MLSAPCFPGLKSGASNRKPPRELKEACGKGVIFSPMGKPRHREGDLLRASPQAHCLIWFGRGGTRDPAECLCGISGSPSPAPTHTVSPILQAEKLRSRADEAKPLGAAEAPMHGPSSFLLWPCRPHEPVELGPPPAAHPDAPTPPRPAPPSPISDKAASPPQGLPGSTAGNCPVFCQPRGNSQLGDEPLTDLIKSEPSPGRINTSRLRYKYLKGAF